MAEYGVFYILQHLLMRRHHSSHRHGDSSSPLHLFVLFLLSSLCFHLLHLDGVRLPAAHVQLMVPHAQL